ncbi:hypothetical protein E8E14_000258 [Neopestalotiopsis sp. 37M]|nr:hypothetical protein E8E14_000258 [Neopestalotiopsis sp. 37M]
MVEQEQEESPTTMEGSALLVLPVDMIYQITDFLSIGSIKKFAFVDAITDFYCSNPRASPRGVSHLLDVSPRLAMAKLVPEIYTLEMSHISKALRILKNNITPTTIWNYFKSHISSKALRILKNNTQTLAQM